MRHTLTALTVAAGTAGLMATPGLAANPYDQTDGSWISLSGTIAEAAPDAFTLDYGDGVITVEMNDWHPDADGLGLASGDEVKVTGRVDQNLFSADTIEAEGVYVKDISAYFHANDVDEEEIARWAAPTEIVVSRTTMNGTVTATDPAEREFTLDIGPHQVTVEAEYVGYNPLDDQGFQQIDPGDRVSVSGVWDRDFMEGQVLEADTVVTLVDNTDTSS